MDTLSNTRYDSPIEKFYAGQSVLVTGATGFIGKVLIEKLLYSCPKLDKIYLLIRSSKGKTPKERLEEMVSQRPFTMRLNKDQAREKLVAIDSDLSVKHLGLSQEDCRLLSEKVSIIFHVAASVKFEAPLDVNMRHNVVAVKEMLDLACGFRRLLCFIHVSTAYSNCQLRQIDERIYPMDVPKDPMSLKVTREMIDNRPNTYTYTKAMAENVVCKYASRINVVIVRPSIVMSSLKEPAGGWVDTINGPIGLSVLGALGILQKIKVNSEVVFDLIPVDIVSNALVSIAWASTEKRGEFLPGSSPLDAMPGETQDLDDGNNNNNNNNNNNDDNDNYNFNHNNNTINNYNYNNNNNFENNNNQNIMSRDQSGSLVSNKADGTVKIFNLTTGSENPCSFYHYFNTGRDEAYKKPSTRVLRPLLQIPKQKGMNPVQYYIHKVFSHLLFAYIVDTLLYMVGQKKMAVRAVNKMHHANEIFDYFCSNQWLFVTDNVKRLRQLQSDDDRFSFNCDVRKIDWDHYARISWIGCRRYILKEEDSSMSYARTRYRAICWFYYALKFVMGFSMLVALRTFIGSPIVTSMILMPALGVVYLL